MRLILLGPPGSGKGTASRVLAERLGVEKVVASDLLREESKNNVEYAEKILEFMDAGNLVPNEIVNKVVLEHLRNLSGYVLDGYPRTRNQAEKLEKKLDENDVSIDRIIYLDVTLDVTLKRNLNRLTCPDCGFSPTAGVKECPVCGAKLEKRTDDIANTITYRFDTYQKRTQPLIKYYKDRGMLLEIDANKSIEEVHESIINGLGI